MELIVLCLNTPPPLQFLWKQCLYLFRQPEGRTILGNQSRVIVEVKLNLFYPVYFVALFIPHIYVPLLPTTPAAILPLGPHCLVLVRALCH